MSTAQQEAIVVAIEDPVLHPEAMHVAAATGRPVIETCVPAEIGRASRSASAVLVDASTAETLSAQPRRDRVFFLGLDPGPIDWRSALECHAEQAFLLPAQAPELLTTLGRQARGRGTARTIGVTGVCGGVGASVLAASIVQCAPGQALLVDAAPNSGGADLLLGIEDTPGVRWQDLNLGEGFINAADLWDALPRTKTGVGVLTSARTALADGFHLDVGVVGAAVECAQSGDGVIVVDVPPAGNQPNNLDMLGLCDTVVVVIPAEVRAVAAATSLVAQLVSRRVHPVGIIRHRSWSGMSSAEVERVAQLPIVGRVPHLSGVTKTLETQGLRTVPRALRRVVDIILDEAGVHKAGVHKAGARALEVRNV